MSELKIKAAQAALAYVQEQQIIGIGTGSTVNFFIQELAAIKHHIEGCVVSSKATEALIRSLGIPILDLNAVNDLALYVDGADEVNVLGEMIKGGGGALTREKIIATVAREFICIVDASKVVTQIGTFPIAVEVIPMARSQVARELVQLGGSPEYRQGFVTDNGNIILDVYDLDLGEPKVLEQEIKTITGVVESGLFAHRVADKILMAAADGMHYLK